MMVHIPNFVNADQYRDDWEEDDYFVFAGRLAPEKGIATLIRAAALSRQRLVIAGTGPEEAALRALAAETGAIVTFSGYLSGPALHEAIGRSKALVLPSEWYENAPISVLEAYALGRPVIGARIGGIPEMIREGETGLLSLPGDAASLADALTAMAAKSAAERTAMGRAGRQWIAREFSASAYLDRTLALYRALGAV
jgi:glycosyltransferase involved in cell wall biosynthesis